MANDQKTKGLLPSESVTTLKKMIHSGVERRRRKRLCDLIDKTCKLMPTPFDLSPKAPRTILLERLHSYILDLRNKNDALMFANPQRALVQEISSLRERVQELEQVNRTYLNLLNKAGITSRECADSSLVKQWQGKPLKYSKGGQTNNQESDEEEEDDDGDEEVKSRLTNAVQLATFNNGKVAPLSIQPTGAPILLLTQQSQGLAGTSNGMIIPIIVTGNSDGSTMIHKQTSSVNLISNSCNIAAKVQQNSITVNKVKSVKRKAKGTSKSKLTTTIHELSEEENPVQCEEDSLKPSGRVTRQSARSKKKTDLANVENADLLNSLSPGDAKSVKRKSDSKKCSKRTKRSNSSSSQVNFDQLEIPQNNSTPCETAENLPEKVSEITNEESNKIVQSELEKSSERSPLKMSGTSFEVNTTATSCEGKNSFSYYATSLLQPTPATSNDNSGQTQKTSNREAEAPNELSELKDDKEAKKTLSFSTEAIHRFNEKDSVIVGDVSEVAPTKDSENEPSSDGKRLYGTPFELDSYTNIFGELSTTPNETRLTPTPLVSSHLVGSGPTKSTSFEMSFTSTTPAITCTASSFFTPVSSQAEGSSYSNGMFGQPHTSHHHHHPHQTPFPPFLLTDHTLTSSPHKGSTTAPSSLFPLPDFNAPNTFSPIFDSGIQADQETQGYPRKGTNSSSNSRSKKSSGSGNTSATKSTSRKTGSKKASSTSTTSSTENNLFFPVGNSKRQTADNFLIPGIISPVPSSNSSVNFTANSSSEQRDRYFFGQVSSDQSYTNNNTTSRNYDIDIFSSSKSSQRTGQCSDSVNEDIQQPSSNPIRNYPIFRPQNVSSSSSEPTPATVTNASSSTASTNISSSSVYFSRANLSNSMPYYPTSTSTVSSSTTTGSTGHIPNFNLSNIFPDITLPTSTSMSGTYQYPYLSSSSVDFNTSSKSSNYSSRFNQPVTGSSGQSSSGFLSKLPTILVPKSSSVESLSASNDPKTVAASLYSHSHHHHTAHQNSSIGHHAPHPTNYPSTPFYSHTAPQHNFASSNGNGSGESSSAISPMSIGRIRHNITSSGASSHFSGCDTDLTSMNSNTSHSNRANYHHLVPPGPSSTETSHPHGSQNSLQPFTLYPTAQIQSSASSGDSARMPGGESSGLANSVGHGHAFNPHACHHSSSASSTLGSFGRANSASSNVVHNTHPAPPHHIPFPLFGLSTRTD